MQSAITTKVDNELPSNIKCGLIWQLKREREEIKLANLSLARIITSITQNMTERKAKPMK